MFAALACFVAATLLSSAPTLPANIAPTAEAVRRARNSAIELALVVAADGTPRRLQLDRRDVQASAVLIEHGIEGLRFRPALAPGLLTVDLNRRLGSSTWLNARIEAQPEGSGFPRLSVRVGAWRLPPSVVGAGIDALDWWLARRREQVPPLRSTVSGLEISDARISADVAIPRSYFRALRDLRGPSETAVDAVLLREVYGRLLDYQVRQPAATFAMALRRAFGGRPAGTDAVAYNRAAFVALAMYTVDSDLHRLAGSDVMIGSLMEIVPPELRVGGRADLAKHFALSAALAAAFEPRFTRAMGEWKELDDSLPGGSGFSFVDLTADRAGMHLARAATDPATAERVADLLADTNDTALFPTAAHTLAEGLNEAEFTRRYGGLAGQSYAQAVRRVDRLLERLPLYAPFVDPS